MAAKGGIKRPGQMFDSQRFARALAHPGIDPRLWISLAIVTEVAMDADGPLVDVVLLPSGAPSTARVGTESLQDWSPIAVDDEVIVGYPEAEPAHGLVVLRRLWSHSDPPPAFAKSNPGDRLVGAPPGAKARVVSDTADVLSAPAVLLGGDSASHPLIFGDDFGSTTGPFGTLMTSLISALGGCGTPAGAAAAAAAFTTAVATYQASVKTTVLSKVSQTE